MTDLNVRPHQCAARHDGGQIVWGLVLVAIGAAFLAERQGWVEIDHPWRLWPLVLFAIGLGKLVAVREGGLQAAFPLIWIGSIFLLHNFDVLSLRYSWPLFVVLGGIVIIWGALAPPAATRPAGTAGPEKQS